MRTILIKNASKLMTMVPASKSDPIGILDEHDILTDANGNIAAIGKKLTPPAGTEGDVDIIDARERVVMPGFVNAHEHLWQTMIVGLGCDRDLMGWLPMMRRFAHAMDGPACRAAVNTGASKMLNMGVTSVLDWSHAPTMDFLDGNRAALKASGLRWTLAYAGPSPQNLPDRALWAGQQEDYQVAGVPSAHPAAANTHKSAVAERLQTSFNVHWLESKDQVQERQTEALAQLTAPTTRLVLNHAVHVNQNDVDQLSPRSLFVAHCPASNQRLASGIIDLDLFRRNNITVGLGLDGGTNDSGDMFETMRSTIGLQRASQQCAEVFPSTSEVLCMATMGGAKVMGIDDMVGSLEVGKKADLLVLHPGMLHTARLAPVCDMVVYGMSAANVEHVLVGGAFKKRNFKLLDVDIDAQRRALTDAANRVAATIDLD